MIFAISTQLNRPIHSMDISQAFTQADDLRSDSQLYIHPPYGLEYTPDTVWKLVKPLYGLSIAPKAWADTLKKFIIGYGFKSVNNSDTFFVLDTPEGESMHLVFHVDDLLFNFSSDELGLKFKYDLLSRFDGTDDGPVHTFVGINVERDEYHTHLTQLPLTESLLADFGLTDCNPVKTPMDPGTLLTAHQEGDPDGHVSLLMY